MVTFASIEVGLIYPATAIFVLLVLPIPFLSAWAARLVAFVEAQRPALGISALNLLWMIGMGCFAYSWYEISTKFADEQLPAASFSSVSTAAAADASGRYLRSKWRAERNMYIHAVFFILFAALQRIARLILAKKALQQRVAAQKKAQ